MSSTWFIILLFTFVSHSAFAQTGTGGEVAVAAPQKSATVDSAENVPKGFPPLSKSYTGWWNTIVLEYGMRTISNTNSLTITKQGEEINPTDGVRTFTADGLYTSFGSGTGDVCWNWIDAPMQLRWRQSEVVFLIIPRHPNPDCSGQRSFKLSREKSGRLSWRSADGLSTVYFDPK